MLVMLGLMIAVYCIARLMLVTLTQPPDQTRTVSLTVCLIATLACLGVGYFAVEVLKLANDGRPRFEVR